MYIGMQFKRDIKAIRNFGLTRHLQNITATSDASSLHVRLALPRMMYKTMRVTLGFSKFWTLSIVQYLKEYNFSETVSVSVLK